MSGSTAQDSGTGQTAAIANTVLTGVAPRSIGIIRYYLCVDDPAIAGTITMIFRWVGRDGTPKEHRSTTLSLLGTPQTSGHATFYAADNPLGSPVEFEIAIASLLGSFSYTYWYQIIEDDTGN